MSASSATPQPRENEKTGSMHHEGESQRERELAGYRAGSPWPGEDGGPMRRQSPRLVGAAGRGSGLTRGGAFELTATRAVSVGGMIVLRDPGEVYAMGCRLDADSTSWLERIDGESLEMVRRSPDLAGGPFGRVALPPMPTGICTSRSADGVIGSIPTVSRWSRSSCPTRGPTTRWWSCPTAIL